MAEPKEKKDGVKTLKDVYAGYAEKASKKDDFEFSLLETYDVEFTKDFKGIKKGHVLTGISKVAHDLYDANGVIKLLKKKEGPTDAELDKEEAK
jgi:hypothetical protein